MSGSNVRVQPKTSNELVECSVIEAFVPAISDVNLQELVEAWDGEAAEDTTSIVPFVEQRQFLLLDELVPVVIALRTTPVPEDVLMDFLSRLKITLEARAIGSIAIRQGDTLVPGQSTQANEVLHAVDIDNMHDPITCIVELHADDEDEPTQYLYVFWKTHIPVGRPKAKIQKLGIYFATSAVLKELDEEEKASDPIDDEYLPSLSTMPVNLLQAFHNDVTLAGANLQLSAARLSRATTPMATPVRGRQRFVRGGARKLFRAAPALLWRLRFSTIPDSLQREDTIVALDFEITNFAGCSVCVDSVNVEMATGKVEPLGQLLPLVCRPADQVTLLYRLMIDHDAVSSLQYDRRNRDLTINASANVLISAVCKPRVTIKWNTTVEMPNARPLSGIAPASKALNRLSRQSQSLRDDDRFVSPDALIMSELPRDASSSATVAAGVSVSITGPEKVVVGEAFNWEAFIVNRSDIVQRLAIMTTPKRRGHGKQASIEIAKALMNAPSDTQPIIGVDKRQSIQKGGLSDPTELICMSPEIRIGPLAPGSCHSTQIKFLPLVPGVLHLEAFRMMDLVTQNSIDIRYVPDIVAQ